MSEIRVHFPTTGNPIVMPDPEAVVTGRTFTWVVRNENPKISVVKIEFDQGEKYFPNNAGGDSVCQKPLVKNEASIWAVAPAVGVKNGTKPAKYTVYGLTALGGEVVAKLDPKILPTDP